MPFCPSSSARIWPDGRFWPGLADQDGDLPRSRLDPAEEPEPDRQKQHGRQNRQRTQQQAQSRPVEHALASRGRSFGVCRYRRGNEILLVHGSILLRLRGCARATARHHATTSRQRKPLIPPPLFSSRYRHRYRTRSLSRREYNPGRRANSRRAHRGRLQFNPGCSVAGGDDLVILQPTPPLFFLSLSVSLSAPFGEVRFRSRTPAARRPYPPVRGGPPVSEGSDGVTPCRPRLFLRPFPIPIAARMPGSPAPHALACRSRFSTLWKIVFHTMEKRG